MVEVKTDKELTNFTNSSSGTSQLHGSLEIGGNSSTIEKSMLLFLFLALQLFFGYFAKEWRKAEKTDVNIIISKCSQSKQNQDYVWAYWSTVVAFHEDHKSKATNH